MIVLQKGKEVRHKNYRLVGMTWRAIGFGLLLAVAGTMVAATPRMPLSSLWSKTTASSAEATFTYQINSALYHSPDGHGVNDVLSV